MNRELLQQALDMINTAISSGDWKVDGACDPDSLIRGLKAELALDRKADNARELGLDYEPEQEPVAWMYVNTDGECEQIEYGVCDYKDPHITFLYTSPPRKEWVGLTDEEIACIAYNECEKSFVRLVEAKLKEKNDA